MRIIIIYVLFISLIVSCVNETSDSENNTHITKTDEEPGIPAGAIPIKYRGHIYVYGAVDDIPGNFVFDTGAKNFSFDSLYFNESGLDYDDFFVGKVGGAGENMYDVNVIKDTFSFSYGASKSYVASIPMIQMKPVLGDYADGIIGLSHFDNKLIELDYDHEYIKEHSDFKDIDTNLYSRIKLSKSGNRLYLPVNVVINDSLQISGRFLLDTGSSGSIGITSVVADIYDFEHSVDNVCCYYTDYIGLGGNSCLELFRASSVQFGDYNLPDVRMRYSYDKSGMYASCDFTGILGNNILDRFDIILDLINDNLYLKPNETYSKPYNFPQIGFNYADRSESMQVWSVTGLIKDSNAEKAGLKIDDKIVKLNGKDVRFYSYEMQRNFFKTAKRIELSVLRNKELLIFEFCTENF